jgi:lysophospholipase L1-like esterase
VRAARALIGFSCLVACARSEAPGPAPAPTAEAPAVDAPDPLEDPDRTGGAGDVARRMQPVLVPAATSAHETVQKKMHGGPLPEEPLLHYREVEAPASGDAPLARFHEALSALARGEDADGKVRVAVYGSSSTSADRYTGYLRRYLQARFGDGGPGFVAVVPLWRWHRHELVSVEAGKPWAIEHAQKKKGRLDGRYGLAGASAYTTKKRARTSLEPKDATLSVADLELWFLRQPRGGSFTLEAGGREHRIATAAEAFAPGYFEVPMKAPGSPKLRITTKGDGEVRLFGAVLETDAPGVVVDNLGLGGTRAANHLDWDEALWLDGIRRRAPDLYVLAYGANESIDEDEPIETYRANLGAVLGRFRQALPGSSCLLVGPQDYPMQEEGAADDAPWLPRARLSAIVDVQRDVAGAAGCGFFDTRAMMGGEGSMQAWVAAESPLAKPDHLHLTPLGYLHLGRVLSDAIMAEYDRAED